MKIDFQVGDSLSRLEYYIWGVQVDKDEYEAYLLYDLLGDGSV